MTVVGHGGGCPGYITRFLMNPKDKVAAIVLTNAGDGPAGNSAMNALKVVTASVKEATSMPDSDMPDFSQYEGNYEARPWGGEVAIRQWGDELVAIDLPSDDLSDAMIHLRHEDGDTFVRLDDDEEPREPWVFEISDDGEAVRIHRHSGFMSRIE